jgi:hypothetical protein
LASGELLRRFRVGDEDTSEVDMALGSQLGEEAEVEIYVLERRFDDERGEEGCVVSTYGVDGTMLRPRWRTCLPEQWPVAALLRYPAREDPAGHRVMDITPSGIASHDRLIYLASVGSMVSVFTVDGTPLRAWWLSDSRAKTIASGPNDSIAVDETAVYVARPRARHTDVLACSHHGQHLASFRFENVARLDMRSGLMKERFRSKVSVTSGCVCVTDEIEGRQGIGSMQHVVHCIQFMSS